MGVQVLYFFIVHVSLFLPVFIWIEMTSIKVYFCIVVFCIFQKTLCVSWLKIFLSKYKQWILCVYSAKQTKKKIKQIVINRHPLQVVIQFIDVLHVKNNIYILQMPTYKCKQLLSFANVLLISQLLSINCRH